MPNVTDPPLDPIIAALQDPLVVDFARSCIEGAYLMNCLDHGTTVTTMVNEAFTRLVESTLMPQSILAVANELARDLFRVHDSTFWFSQDYWRYKTHVRQEHDYRHFQQAIVGRSVLDFGCGSGQTSVRLAQAGYRVTATDTLDYRADSARHIPFFTMRLPTKLPFPDDSFDTAIAYTVIHHIDANHIPTIIQELGRVARQVLIIEDVYGVAEAKDELVECPIQWPNHALNNEPLFLRFLALERQQQFFVLVLLDFFPNLVVLGLYDMNMPFQFKTVREWQHLVADNGLRLDLVQIIGFEAYRMHPSCRAWFHCTSFWKHLSK